MIRLRFGRALPCWPEGELVLDIPTNMQREQLSGKKTERFLAENVGLMTTSGGSWSLQFTS